MDRFRPDETLQDYLINRLCLNCTKELLTLIINSLRSTMLLIAIPIQKPVFEFSGSSLCIQLSHLTLRGVSIHRHTTFNKNFGFREDRNI